MDVTVTEDGKLLLELVAALTGVAVLLIVTVVGRYRLRRAAAECQRLRAENRRLLESMMSAPDGFFAWIGEGDTLCSRRLAVLLGLPKGTQSDLADVLAAFAEPGRLTAVLASLHQDGIGFDLELAAADGMRRIGVHGTRAAGSDGERFADLVWMRDVTAQAATALDLEQRLDRLGGIETQLRGLIDALPVPVWLRGDDLSLLLVNRAYAAAIDAASAEAAVQGQLELASDGALREARALAARARAAGEPRVERFHLVLGGERRLAALIESPFSQDDRLLTAGIALDETRIEDLRSELDHHVTAHGEVLERLATAIAIFSTDTRLAFFNTAFQRLWRLEAEWLVSQPTYGSVLDTLRERRLLPEAADYRAYKEEELKRFISLIDAAETLMHLPDGRTLRRVISAHPYGGLIFTYEDVTDSLALERSFNTMLAVQRETLDHLHEALAVFGSDGRLKLFNPAFVRLWAFEAADLDAGPHVTEVIERLKPFFAGRPGRTSGWAPVRDALGRLFSERRAESGRVERQDGVILDYAGVPLPDGAMLLGWLDVTDSARVERALRERNEALAAADLLKSEFIANVAAELNSPLATIVDLSEMLTAGYCGGLEPRQLEYADAVAIAGRTLKTLVSDILDLAAIEAGQMTLELDAVAIHPMLSAVLALVRERVREKKLTLDVRCPLDIGWIVADQRRLKQVMYNLISNAAKFTPPGGTITVSAQRTEGELALAVSDTGPGIPAAEQAQVFDSFVRGGDSHGPGLGLALVKRFVELHGGRVALESCPEGGTTVTVRLPTTMEEAE